MIWCWTDGNSKTKELAQLVTDSRTFMSQIAKAKTAKLSKLALSFLGCSATDEFPVRTLIDYFPPTARDLQMQVVNENIEWAKKERRVFLRQSLEIKLVGL